MPLAFPALYIAVGVGARVAPVPGVNFESFYREGYLRTPLRTFAVEYAISAANHYALSLSNTGLLLAGTPFTE